MTHLPSRLIGVGILLATALTYDADASNMVHRLLIPAFMALGAWLVVQNLAAVLIAVAVVAATRSDLASADTLASRVYPIVALVAGCALGAIGLLRFRARIVATRAARWRGRNSDRSTS